MRTRLAASLCRLMGKRRTDIVVAAAAEADTQLIVAQASAHGTELVFGSRADDSARGGDIDLLVESDHAVDQPVLVSASIGARLQLARGDQRIDVVLAAPNVPDQAIHQIARATGIVL